MERGRGFASIGPGSVLAGEWRLDSLVGVGETSEVYAATHRSARRFALKVFDPALTADPETCAALVAVAYLPNRVPHEGVVHALDRGASEGVVFTAMELVGGETLSQRWVREGRRLRPTDALDLALGVLEVLSAIHEQRLVHGALSLDHVLVAPNGRVRLVGLGSSGTPKRADVAGTLSFDVGTAPFVAPEQALDASATARSDLFAVAAMTFALVTGTSVLDGAARSFASALPNLATPLSRVLDRALAFDPSGRWSTAMAMREALSDALSEAVRVKTGPQTALAAGETTMVSAPHPGSSRVRGVPMREPGSAALPRLEPRAPDATVAPAQAARRSTTLLAVASLDRLGAATLRARTEASGLRLEPVLSDAALVMARVGGDARDEALELASFALDLALALPSVAMSLVTGVDLLTDHEGTNGALRGALSRPASAARGPVRLDAASARLVEGLFDIAWDPMGPVLAGMRAPEGGFRKLLGRPTEVVGRDTQIAELSASFSKAVAQESAQAVLVVAPAGVGKSRLVEEVVVRVRGRHPEVEVWSVTAEPMRRDSAFGVAALLVLRAAGVSRDDAPEVVRRAIRARVEAELGEGARDVDRVAEFLTEVAGLGASSEASSDVARARRDAASMGDQMRFAFLDFLAAILAKRPLLVVVEDLPWADTASVELLGHALSLLKPKPWAILATARPEIDEVFPRLWPATRRPLSGLDRASLETIARAADPTMPEAERGRAADAAAGNPLLLEELLRARTEASALPESSSVAEIVARRIDALDPEVATVLSRASVFGTAFSLSGVAALVAQETPSGAAAPTRGSVAACLDELERRELVVLRPRSAGAVEYAFRHAVVREVAYARMLAGDRASAHRTAGVFLERSGEREPAVLAGHFARANAAEEAAAWYERSAAEALERSDVTQTLALAERGLAYGPRADVALSLLAMLAECRVWRLEYAEARAAATEVLSRAPRGRALFCRALASLATALTRGGDLDGALRLADGILGDATAPEDKPSYASALTALVASFLRQSRHDLVRGLMEKANALGDERAADPATIAHVESARSWCAMFAGDFSECLRHDREVVRRFQEACDLRNACRETTSIGYDLMVLGAYEDAEAAFRKALATAERLGIARVVAGAKHHLALVTLRLGRLDEAHALALEALDLGRASTDPFALGSMRLYLGIVLAARGDDLGAARSIEDALAGFQATPAAQAWPLALLAQLRLSEGRVDEGLLLAERAMGVVAATGPAEEGDATIRVVYAEALARAGRAAEATVAAGRALQRLQERADRISDATLKQSFLHRVPEHARTLELARALGAPMPAPRAP